ncbi:hypothetical protein GCM10011571_29170 [Marinithermofilum abyssi]|uniref:Ribosomal protein eL8/eL30/eS12/Gadd45 domain-containing protein n=1 Tax=Marinithermofilum abyssi TaxID=1571185 RepID=A0A8J2VHL6_9BACL|nr:YlxQ family RNA-binding protein [Marinithermofilum abyssi]GGE25169.1 hypothetical protein GCM10011571_29170 [Marinithermofilum abyssi]
MDKLYQLLGLAMRAGKVVTGEETVLQAIRGGRAHLVLISRDASPNAVKKMTDKCAYYRVPLVQAGTRVELGKAVGKESRVVLAVTDPGFSRTMRKLVQVTDGGDHIGESSRLRIRKTDEHDQQRGFDHPEAHGDQCQQSHERNG